LWPFINFSLLISKLEINSVKHLLLENKLVRLAANTAEGLRNLVVQAVAAGCPVPVFSASINYLDQLRMAKSSANLIQAQRDYFGAHTFERTDGKSGEFHHWNW
jgi:6-phosphogluconate dehydrogenase